MKKIAAVGVDPLTFRSQARSFRPLGQKSLTPNVFAEVLAASTGDEITGVVLDVRDYGEVRAADVERFKR